MKYLLIFLISTLYSLYGHSEAPPVILDKNKEAYNIDLNLNILEDPTGKLTINDVSSKAWENKFERNKKKNPNFGYSKSSFWARFKVINNSSREKRWILFLNYYQQDNVEFYSKKNGQWKMIQTGDMFSFSKRQLKARNFSFKINPQMGTTYFVKINGSVNRLGLLIYSAEQFANKDSKKNLYYGLFFGVVIAMVGYNFFIFVTTKSSSYLFYTLYVLSFGLVLANFNGYNQKYLFPDYPWVSNNGQAFFVGAMFFFLTLFTVTFLRLKESNPKIYWFFIGWSMVGVLIMICSFFAPYNFNVRLFIMNGLIECPFLLAVGIYRWKNNYRPSKYFVAAFLCVLVGIFMIGLVTRGQLPDSDLFHNSALIGNAIELILLSMGLADRFNLIQEEANALQKNYATKLEEQVREKTQELNLEKETLNDVLNQTSEQKKSRDQLLGSLTQGYLTFDKQGVIGEGATNITEDLLETVLKNSIMEELKIWDVLFKEENKKDNFKRWVDKIYENKISFRDLKELAPKTFEGTKGKFIRLDFRPIYQQESNTIEKVIMIASDKTQELKLKQKIEEDKQHAYFIRTCLENPVDFVDILEDTFSIIETGPELSKGDNSELFRVFHTLKARYGQFGLKKITTAIDKIETSISEKNNNSLKSEIAHFKKLADTFVKENRLIIEAANKFLVDEGSAVQVSEVIEKAKEFQIDGQYLDFLRENYLLSDIKNKFERYRPLVDQLADKQGKAINVHIKGDEVRVDTNQYSNFINTSIHLFRNMVDHGIEPEDERIEKTKDQRGSISVEFKKNGNSFTIVIQDDGAGIDPEKIKNITVQKGLKKLSELTDITQQGLINMIFLPGFSTKEEVTEYSGRGIGMDAVREEVENLGGKIEVSSTIDEGTQFTIELPILT
tara:strand:- start:1911 stop:4598 length:2688 start_codon:yes stop_codon:yes gene_type:complete